MSIEEKVLPIYTFKVFPLFCKLRYLYNSFFKRQKFTFLKIFHKGSPVVTKTEIYYFPYDY